MAFWHVSSRFVIWAKWNVVVLFFSLPSVFNVEFGHFPTLSVVYFFGGCSRCDMPERWLSRHCMRFPVTAGLLRGSSLKRGVFSQDDRRGQCCVHVWEPTRTIPFPLRLRQPWICRGFSSAPDTVLIFQESCCLLTSQENSNIFTARGQIRNQKQHQGFYVNAWLVSNFVSTYVDDLYCVCPSETTLVLGI